MPRVVILPYFLKSAKGYLKKYRSLERTIVDVLGRFSPSHHVHLGNNIYKVRFSIKEITKGKSKVFRLILRLTSDHKFLIPVFMYFKGDRETVSDNEINEHLSEILLELKEFERTLN
ncbi:MAG: hypothetical protein ABH833_04050 [Parcubacteria group bacterium]